METPPTTVRKTMPNPSDRLLLLNGVAHHLDALIKAAGAAPTISFTVADLSLDGGGKMGPRHPVTFQPADLTLEAGHIVLYKLEGKYVVLLGHDKLKETVTEHVMADPPRTKSLVLKGKLISTPLLKRYRVEEVVAAPAPRPVVAAPAPYWQDREEVVNRPRFRNLDLHRGSNGLFGGAPRVEKPAEVPTPSGATNRALRILEAAIAADR